MSCATEHAIASSRHFGRRIDHCQLTISSKKMIVIGGEIQNDKMENDVWSSRDCGSSWTMCDRAPWAARSAFGSCFVNGKIVVFGGDHGPFDAWELSGVW